MRRTLAKTIASLACLCFLSFAAAGCSQNGGDGEGDKGAVDKLTDRAAEKAVTEIRTPLDKAREAAGSGDERDAEMERAVRSQ